MTLVQRFSSTLNLNIHFHMIFPDDVYLPDGAAPVFRHATGPHGGELRDLVQQIAARTARPAHGREFRGERVDALTG